MKNAYYNQIDFQSILNISEIQCGGKKQDDHVCVDNMYNCSLIESTSYVTYIHVTKSIYYLHVLLTNLQQLSIKTTAEQKPHRKHQQIKHNERSEQ